MLFHVFNFFFSIFAENENWSKFPFGVSIGAYWGKNLVIRWFYIAGYKNHAVTHVLCPWFGAKNVKEVDGSTYLENPSLWSWQASESWTSFQNSKVSEIFSSMFTWQTKVYNPKSVCTVLGKLVGQFFMRLTEIISGGPFELIVLSEIS